MKHFARPGFPDLELDFGIPPRPPREYEHFLLQHELCIPNPSKELVNLLHRERYKALYGCWPEEIEE